MPIRINLLAEAQALEEMRRRDPVKRAIWGGLVAVILLLAWSSSLQLKAMIAKGELNRTEAQLAARTNEYQAVLTKQSKLAEVNRKLTGLNQLGSSRLLQATILDALQHTAIDQVRLTRMHTEQTYVLTAAVKGTTNANKQVTGGKPATATEKILLVLDARDTSANPGDLVNRYKQAISDYPYFREALGSGSNEVRLTSLSPPVSNGSDRPFVSFTLECRYPERTR